MAVKLQVILGNIYNMDFKKIFDFSWGVLRIDHIPCSCSPIGGSLVALVTLLGLGLLGSRLILRKIVIKKQYIFEQISQLKSLCPLPL